jgi:hypothetical protein
MATAATPRHIVTLPQPVRYLVRNGSHLSHTGRCLGKGAVILLGPIEELQYGHFPKDAAPFTIDGWGEYYFLVDEIPIVGIREKLEALNTL